MICYQIVKENVPARIPSVKWRDLSKVQAERGKARTAASQLKSKKSDAAVIRDGADRSDSDSEENPKANSAGGDYNDDGAADDDDDGDSDIEDLPMDARVRDQFAVGNLVDLKSPVLLDFLSDEERTVVVEQPRKSTTVGNVAAGTKLKASDWTQW